MDVSHGQGLCHSLYITLDGAFPKSIMPIGVEHNLKQKIRKKLRKVGWDTLFRLGEEWERTVGGFAIRALDTVYTAYGQNPWFWGVAWPAVLGAAAADFWPHVATPLERRAVAHDATKGHLNALFAAHATEGTDLLVSLSAASGATSSADHAPAMLKRRALGSQSCHITDLPFGAEGYRHCVLIIIKSVGGLRLTQVVLGQTCRSLHTWFSSRFDEADGLQQQPTTSQQMPGASGGRWSGAERAPPLCSPWCGLREHDAKCGERPPRYGGINPLPAESFQTMAGEDRGPPTPPAPEWPPPWQHGGHGAWV